MAVDLDEPIKRDHTANVKNHRIRRLTPTSVVFNGIPSTIYFCNLAFQIFFLKSILQCDAIRSEHFLGKCVFTKYEIYKFLGIYMLW